MTPGGVRGVFGGMAALLACTDVTFAFKRKYVRTYVVERICVYQWGAVVVNALFQSSQ